MKILITTGIFPPDVGGPASYVPAIARECLLRRHSVRVVTYGSRDALSVYEFPVTRVRRAFLPLRYFLFLIACLRYGYGADVIFAQDATSSGFPATLAALLLRKRLVVKIVGDFSWEYARNAGLSGDTLDGFQVRTSYPFVPAALRRVQRFVCRRADAVIVPSEYLKGIVAGWGASARKINVIRNAVTVPLPAKLALREPLLVFSAGRLVPWKGFDGLIRAFAKACRAFPQARLVIAGDGPCEAELEAEARRTGITSRISFLGAVSPEAMRVLHARAGCFVLFSSYEGFSHVLLEAIACGTPVIASDAGGNPELITEGSRGMLVPSGDEDALAAALSSFFSAPSAVFPDAGRPARKPFPWNELADTTFRLLEKSS